MGSTLDSCTHKCHVKLGDGIQEVVSSFQNINLLWKPEREKAETTGKFEGGKNTLNEWCIKNFYSICLLPEMTKGDVLVMFLSLCIEILNHDKEEKTKYNLFVYM